MNAFLSMYAGWVVNPEVKSHLKLPDSKGSQLAYRQNGLRPHFSVLGRIIISPECKIGLVSDQSNTCQMMWHSFWQQKNGALLHIEEKGLGLSSSQLASVYGENGKDSPPSGCCRPRRVGVPLDTGRWVLGPQCPGKSDTLACLEAQEYFHPTETE